MNNFNTLVIGRGLVGTAAAKYLSSMQEKVAVIGPDEPTDYDQSLVFASHYDQARVQRMIGKDDVWTRLNVDSVGQYEGIQHQSGINFHNPVGCLYVNPAGRDGYLERATALNDRFHLPFKSYSKGAEITRDFGDFNFPSNAEGLFEASPAGFINPRLLQKAQQKIFEQQGGVVVKDTVLEVRWIDHVFQVFTHKGNRYCAQKVLLAAGAFTNFFNLIPKKIALTLKSEVVLLVKVSEAMAIKLAQLPSLLYEINDGATEGIYLIQPVQYPDGAYYLKMGCNMPEDLYFDRIEQVQDWFRKGDSDRFTARLTAALSLILPGIAISETLTKRCIISRSIHGRPYIGEHERAGLFIAAGCNGYSAMCSDAIGSVAAQLIVHGAIPMDYAPDSFEIIYQ